MGTATYFVLNLSVLVVATLSLWRFIERDRTVWWTLAVVILPLTIVFDSLCIALGIFGYNPAVISGLYIGSMPVEDLFYAVVALLIVPALWKLYDIKKEAPHAR